MRVAIFAVSFFAAFAFIVVFLVSFECRRSPVPFFSCVMSFADEARACGLEWAGKNLSAA